MQEVHTLGSLLVNFVVPSFIRDIIYPIKAAEDLSVSCGQEGGCVHRQPLTRRVRLVPRLRYPAV